jgi:cold shock protein
MASDGIGDKFSKAGIGPDDSRSAALGNDVEGHLIEIGGVIKWFDVSKGYGWIVPDNGMQDVLLHVTCLRSGGYETAYEGARIVCEVLVRPIGLQAFRVLSMDDSTAIHPAQLPPPQTHVAVVPTSGLERAQVKWFNRLRGFGFLTRGEGTPDIFVHMETLRRFGITELRPGQFVQVRYGPGPKGPMVAEIHPENYVPSDRLGSMSMTAAPSTRQATDEVSLTAEEWSEIKERLLEQLRANRPDTPERHLSYIRKAIAAAVTKNV